MGPRNHQDGHKITAPQLWKTPARRCGYRECQVPGSAQQGSPELPSTKSAGYIQSWMSTLLLISMNHHYRMLRFLLDQSCLAALNPLCDLARAVQKPDKRNKRSFIYSFPGFPLLVSRTPLSLYSPESFEALRLGALVLYRSRAPSLPSSSRFPSPPALCCSDFYVGVPRDNPNPLRVPTAFLLFYFSHRSPRRSLPYLLVALFFDLHGHRCSNSLWCHGRWERGR